MKKDDLLDAMLALATLYEQRVEAFKLTVLALKSASPEELNDASALVLYYMLMASNPETSFEKLEKYEEALWGYALNEKIVTFDSRKKQ